MEVEQVLDAFSPVRARKDSFISSPKFTTPNKQQIEGEDWKSCYELTDDIAAIYPSTVRIPYPFAIPREVRLEFRGSRFCFKPIF